MDRKRFTRRFPEATEIGRDATPDELVVFFDNGKDVGGWRENRRTTTGAGELLGSDDAATARHRYARSKAVQPQDKDSGLVERSWVRTSRRAGKLTETTLEGERVAAAWQEKNQVERAAGKVIRNEAGELVIESWADGVRRETAVPRDSSVDRNRR